MSLSNMRIGARMVIGFSAVLLLAIFIGVSGYWGVTSTAGTTEKLLRGDAKIAEHSARARANVNALRRFEKDFFINMGDKAKEEGYMKSWREEHDSLMARLSDLEKYASLEQDKEMIKSMKTLAAIYDGGFNKVVNLIHSGNVKTTQEANAAIGEFKDAIHKMEGQAKDLATEGNKRMAAAEDAVKAASSRTTFIMIILALCSIVLALGISFIITRSVARPLNRAISGLSDGSEQVAAAARQVSSSSQQLAEGSSEQASSLEETSSSLEEMSSMTKQNADNSSQAKAMMAEVRKIVEKVNGHMGNMVKAIDEITSSSQETGKIIKTIDEIAFQTNLLALNAAVEAARAGEAGAGFAVVADEVRNLALRAADAAKNTNSLIENTIKAVKNGNDLTHMTQEAFKENATISGKVEQLVDEIAAASQEQAHGIAEVNKAVVEMEKVTQKTAANAEESAAASEELNSQAEQMKGYVADLTMLVGGNGSNAAASYRSAVGPGEGLHQPSGTGRVSLALPVRKTMGKAASLRGQGFMKVTRPDQVIPLDDEDFKDF